MPTICILQVEAGDIIVRVNGTDVHHFTTKEGNEHENKNKIVLVLFYEITENNINMFIV